MPSASLVAFPHFLEDQFVWMSIAAWCVLLAWLRPRMARQQMLLWVALVLLLHLSPIVSQAARAMSAVTALVGDKPAAFWILQGFNLLLLGLIVFTGLSIRHRAARSRQAEAVLAERRRIADDLHDGVGSRLVALLAGQEPGTTGPSELSMALQACLLELHMTVDSLHDQACATVAQRLAHLRYRLQPAFDRLGILLEWNVREVETAHPLPAEAANALCKIAQEALSNVMRHSHAKRVQVRFGPLEKAGGLVLEVRDDGRGLAVSPETPPEQLGKGLRSMRARADALRGTLSLMNAAPHGLCVRVVVPC